VIACGNQVTIILLTVEIQTLHSVIISTSRTIHLLRKILIPEGTFCQDNSVYHDLPEEEGLSEHAYVWQVHYGFVLESGT
jgi:hypothetical protein